MENFIEESQTKIIASTNVFQIELVEKLGREDYSPLIDISLHLAKEYGRQAVLTKNTIEKYFDAEKCLPFIAKYQGEIIAYIIGIPLEELREEKWTITDENFGKGNTLYTYAFVIMEKKQIKWLCKNVKKSVYKLGKEKREYKIHYWPCS
ncbi:MAG: hypothetical protein Ct9H90mP15_07110 [Candidatus Neomarinimicrobiota bacterium]|nr:MAG: hypothetical protein Ct9H90mP15_07110 [Candidatus Neomarinimicrobiota bacterium]